MFELSSRNIPRSNVLANGGHILSRPCHCTAFHIASTQSATWKRFPRYRSIFAKVKESHRKCGYSPIFDWTSTEVWRNFECWYCRQDIVSIYHVYMYIYIHVCDCIVVLRVCMCIYLFTFVYDYMCCMYIIRSVHLVCMHLEAILTNIFFAYIQHHIYIYMDTVHAPSVSLYTLQELSERYAFATSSQGSI